MALPEGLLEDVKNYLDITWVDEGTDSKITGIVERGTKYIDRIAGSGQNYTLEDKPRELLFEYCRYARSNALGQFKINYLHEIISLQVDKEVVEYEIDNPTT